MPLFVHTRIPICTPPYSFLLWQVMEQSLGQASVARGALEDDGVAFRSTFDRHKTIGQKVNKAGKVRDVTPKYRFRCAAGRVGKSHDHRTLF